MQHRGLINIKILYVMSILATWRMEIFSPFEQSRWSWRPSWLLGSSIRGRSRVLRTARWSSVTAEKVCVHNSSVSESSLNVNQIISSLSYKTDLDSTTLIYYSIRLNNKRASEMLTYIDSFPGGNEITNRKSIPTTK